MNALRKILNNLQKYATTVTPVKKDINAVTPSLLEKHSLEETDPDRETPGSEIDVNAATPHTLDTNECLKEFDDILEEINNDVTKGASLDDIDDVLKDMAQEDRKDFMFDVPKFDLAEILVAFENLKDDDVDVTNGLISLDDSINSFSDIYIANSNEVIEQNDVITKSEDSRPEGSVKNISTENTGNIEQNIDINSMNTEETKENIKHSESFECEKLDDSNICTEKDQGIEKQTSLHEATNEEIDKTNESTDKTNESLQDNPVKSCKKENDQTAKDVVFMDDSDDGGYQSSDFEFITEEEAKINGLIINFKNNSHKRKFAKVNSVKTIEVAVDQFSNEIKSPTRNKMKRKTRNINKDPDWSPESDTYSTSDDDFIPDDMEYLTRNNTRSKNNNTPAKNPERNNSVTFSLRQIRIPPRRYNGSPRFGNLQINSESFTSRNITEYNVDVRQNNEGRDGPSQHIFRGFSNECRNELATMKMEANDKTNLFKTETDDLELAQVDISNSNLNPGLPENADSVRIIPASSYMQDNHPDSNKMAIKTNKMQDGSELNNISTLTIPEKNNVDAGLGHSQNPEENVIPETSTDNVPDPENIIPGTSSENVPDENNLNPGPSGTLEMPKFVNFGAGPSYKRKRSHIDEIEKWRMYQMRTRLNRPQFVLDYSYRDHHRIYQDNELHQLFDPNRAPLPTARSIRLLENKSTVCKNSMLVEYQGLMCR